MKESVQGKTHGGTSAQICADMWKAFMEKDSDGVEALLKHGDVRKFINTPNAWGRIGEQGVDRTLLGWAFSNSDKDKISMSLIRHGADVNCDAGNNIVMTPVIKMSCIDNEVSFTSSQKRILDQYDNSELLHSILANRVLASDIGAVRAVLGNNSRLFNLLDSKTLLGEITLQATNIGFDVSKFDPRLIVASVNSDDNINEVIKERFMEFLTKFIGKSKLEQMDLQDHGREAVCEALYMQLASSHFKQNFLSTLGVVEAHNSADKAANIAKFSTGLLPALREVLFENHEDAVDVIIQDGGGLFEPLLQLNRFHMIGDEVTESDKSALEKILISVQSTYEKEPLAAGNSNLIKELQDDNRSLRRTVEVQEKQLVAQSERISRLESMLEQLFAPKVEQEGEKSWASSVSKVGGISK